MSHVRRLAPWLLDLLLDAVRAQVVGTGEATIVFIHGWNAIQATCDVGIGARRVGGALEPVGEGRATIAPGYLSRLLDFSRTCRSRGIEVTFGDRYPAAGRDNMLQIFTARFADDADPRIRELARLGAEGKISAVQLELAVPLRWPGELRSGIIDAVAGLLGTERSDPADGVDDVGLEPGAGSIRERFAIEFHDGRAGIGGFSGIERLASGRRHGRFLLCAGATRLGLFTGEDARGAGASLRCQGLSWTAEPGGGGTLEYAGPCLTFPRSDPFLDLEAGLADAELSRFEAKLEWRPTPPAARSARSAAGARLGRIEGRVSHGGS
ncbi:MAG: hypothetical protein ACREQQ_14150, partial [Candidatus Binatia bacterium]